MIEQKSNIIKRWMHNSSSMTHKLSRCVSKKWTPMLLSAIGERPLISINLSFNFANLVVKVIPSMPFASCMVRWLPRSKILSSTWVGSLALVPCLSSGSYQVPSCTHTLQYAPPSLCSTIFKWILDIFFSWKVGKLYLPRSPSAVKHRCRWCVWCEIENLSTLTCLLSALCSVDVRGGKAKPEHL